MNLASIGSDVPALLKLDAVARIALAMTALIGMTILGAWLFPALASMLPHGWDLMKANTAVGMLLATAGMWMPASTPSSGTPASRIFAGALSLLALLILLEHITGRHLDMDTWLAADAASPDSGVTSARTAAGLLLIGLLIPCMQERRGALCIAADTLTFALVGLVLVLLSGYFYGAARLVGESSLILVSAQTLTCFLLLAFVAVVRRLEYGWLSTLFGNSRVGRVVVITAPLVIALIYTTGFFYIYVRQKELLSRSDAVALSVALLSMVVLYVILLMGGRINRLEQNVRDLMLGKSRAELQESEQRYGELVEQAITGFVVRRPDGQLILVNEAYRSMTGYSREELLTLKARDLVADTAVLEKVARLQPGESTRIETLLRRKDGGLLEVQYVTQRLRNGNLQSVLLDVSERKRAEQAKAESEQRYAELVDQALEGITVRKPTGEFIFVNDTFCSMLGYTHAELLRMRITDVVHPEDAETTRQVQRLNSGGSLRIEKRMRRKDGRIVHVQVSARRLQDGNFQSTVQDVSERKEADLRSQVYMEELRQMSQRLLEAQETERRAIARELHDEIGQALTATRMNLRDLGQRAGDGPLAQRAADTSAIVEGLLQQVRQLSLDLHPTVLDDLGLAAALRWLMRTRLGSSELHVTQELTEDLPRYTSTVEHTAFRVFQEALSNVLRHSGARNLSVRLALQGEQLQLEVRDDGHGFDPAAARKHALAGASLGVIGMHERVRLADGHIVIESSPGQGTLVRVSLPAMER
jgi:two-component system sensor histidine kinase UhpB